MIKKSPILIFTTSRLTLTKGKFLLLVYYVHCFSFVLVIATLSKLSFAETNTTFSHHKQHPIHHHPDYKTAHKQHGITIRATKAPPSTDSGFSKYRLRISYSENKRLHSAKQACYPQKLNYILFPHL